MTAQGDGRSNPLVLFYIKLPVETWDAKDHLVISVLTDQCRFVVPIYQRQCSWREPRLGPFWDDVVAKAAEEAFSGALPR